jgi:hypothetical protein
MTNREISALSPSDLRPAFRFFLEHAGYCTPPGRAVSALQLARAEAQLTASDLQVLERPDDQPAYCYCDDPHCEYHEGSTHEWDTLCVAIVRPCAEHGVECRHTEWLASLSGIIEPSRDDLRVVRAELASELDAAVFGEPQAVTS